MSMMPGGVLGARKTKGAGNGGEGESPNVGPEVLVNKLLVSSTALVTSY